jgi:hypothetical protein
MRKCNVLKIFLLPLLALVALTGAPLFGQDTTASIAGRVVDSSGAVIPGALVKVTNAETNEIRTATTNGEGNFLVLSLPVSRYTLEASKAGFKTKIETGITLVVGQRALMNMVLPIGSVDESVTVSSGASVVNLSTASVAGYVGQREVKNLPLDGRSYDNLIALNTSAINYSAYDGTAASGGGAGAVFHVDGRRMTENLFLLNGIEYTGESNRENTPGGVSGQLLGVDAIREFNVLEGVYSAEYGKRDGAQINVVTMSGTNELHGTGFEFIRNSALDARNYFDAPVSQIGRRIPGFQRNQFGGALGGPIVKDKVFAFGNYEGFRQILGVSDEAIVPDNNARMGILPNSSGVPTPVVNANPGMTPFFALWPKANGAELGAGLAVYVANPKETIREDFGTIRFDQNLSAKDTFSEVYTIDDGLSAVPQQDPVFQANYFIENHVASVQELHIFSPRTLNTFRAGYSRAQFDFNIAPSTPLPSNLDFMAGLEPGQLSIGGGLTTSSGTTTVTKAGGTSDYEFGVRNLFTYDDDIQLVRGRNNFSFGVWFQRMQDNRSGANRKAGQVTFSTLTTFIQGTESAFQATPDPSYSGYRMWMGAWYAQDNINVTPRLVVNLGVRHDFTNILSEVHGHIANDFLSATYSGAMSPTPVIGTAFPTNNAKLDFSPRVGLAWDVFGNGKTAVRSGFGIYYNLVDYEFWTWDGIAPFNTTVSYPSNSPFLSEIGVPVGVPGPPDCGPGVTGSCQTISQKGFLSNVSPSAQEWDLSVEQLIAPKTSLRVAYVGSHGVHEPISVDYNSVIPTVCANAAGCVSGGLNPKTTGTVPQGTFYDPVVTALPDPYLVSSTETQFGNSSYNALQAEVRHNFASGLQFRVNYTWAHDLDVADEIGGTESANSPPQVMEPYGYGPKADWGNSSSDVRHAVSASGSYELPIGNGKYWLNGVSGVPGKLVSGWQLDSILTLLSGMPFTPLVGSNISGDGNTTNPDRPELNTAFTGPIITHNPKQWYNPNAFKIPIPGTFSPMKKGSFRGPGLSEWDVSAIKATPITDKLSAEFRFEGFNILNRTNFSFPNQTVFSGSAINPSAGIITATTTTSRELQAAIKLIF